MTPWPDLLPDTGQLQSPTGGDCVGWKAVVNADLFTESFLIPSVLFPASGTACRTFFVMERPLRLGLGFFLLIPWSGGLFANSRQRKEDLLTGAFFGGRVRGRLLPQ